MTFEQLKNKVAEKYPEAGNLIHILTVAFVEGYQLREREETMKKDTFTPRPDHVEQAYQSYSNVLLMSVLLIGFLAGVSIALFALTAGMDQVINITSELVR